jgi:hypothetical protein
MAGRPPQACRSIATGCSIVESSIPPNSFIGSLPFEAKAGRARRAWEAWNYSPRIELRRNQPRDVYLLRTIVGNAGCAIKIERGLPIPGGSVMAQRCR